MTSTSDCGYLLENRAAPTGDRFDSLSALFNPVTFRRIERLGIGPGWRCWEVGAGGPSIPHWLSRQVAPDGRVLATDIDVSWMAALSSGDVDVIRHDVVDDEPPAGPFDLVHARLVLVHLPGRLEGLRHMIRAVAPGGWLLIEDFDMEMQPLACPAETGPDQRRANRIRAAFRVLLFERGAAATFGRGLPGLLRDAGLVDVGADAYLPIALPASVVLDRANVIQLQTQLVDRGLVSDEDISLHLDALDSGRLDISTPPLVSAWGRVAS
jgi:hypothetical protein